MLLLTYLLTSHTSPQKSYASQLTGSACSQGYRPSPQTQDYDL